MLSWVRGPLAPGLPPRHVKAWSAVLAACAALLSIAGCPGEQRGNGNGDDVPSGAIQFARDIQPIFDRACADCHAPGGFADDTLLFLNEGAAYRNLVNVRSSVDAALIRVVPGDSEASLLFLKVSSDDPPIGNRMPLFGDPLSVADIERIQRWIDEGAAEN